MTDDQERTSRVVHTCTHHPQLRVCEEPQHRDVCRCCSTEKQHLIRKVYPNSLQIHCIPISAGKSVSRTNFIPRLSPTPLS